ncbi:MAG: dienelactone hydrolase family protein [Nitrososphaerales archaeon]|nr:dienelactone hydrolase family protein [Nitrososphaerales archaeon]
MTIPDGARSVVIFAHGSGSSRLSPRNRYVAEVLQEAGLGTLLFDLLTQEEDLAYGNRFDIDLLTDRLSSATDWLMAKTEMDGVRLAYFGASTGAAAALRAAIGRKEVSAIVSRGGRPDLAWDYLGMVEAPTLLIVGGLDTEVIELNKLAFKRLKAEAELAIVPGATHLFEEAGALEEVARLGKSWFLRFLRPPDDDHGNESSQAAD